MLKIRLKLNRKLSSHTIYLYPMYVSIKMGPDSSQVHTTGHVNFKTPTMAPKSILFSGMRMLFKHSLLTILLEIKLSQEVLTAQLTFGMLTRANVLQN